MKATRKQFHDALIGVMSDARRRFQQETDIGSAMKPGARKYSIGSAKQRLRIRVSGHADFFMDALIHDGEIGSLGLVHFLIRASEAQVRKAIDDAAYLRHLLLEEARFDASAATSYAVEVVLAVDPSDAETSNAISDVLNDVLREGSYLHAVGVNLWSIQDENSVRRAFSWLLTDAEEWFARRNAPTDDAAIPLEAVTLTDVRVPGKREFAFGVDRQLHLIHGHNGSGKSSFCEALELVMTNKVARLGNQDHRVCLTSRYAKKATIAIRRQGEPTPRMWTVGAEGLADGPKSNLNADSFRLDQSVADRLIQGSTAERARIFLDAFFPDDATTLLEKTRREARETFEKFPTKVAMKLSDDREPSLDAAIKLASARLQWLDDPSWKEFLRLMPLDPELVHDLGAMLPSEAAERYDRKGSATESELAAAAQAINAAFRSLGGDLAVMIAVAEQCVALLEKIGEVSFSAEADSGDDLETLMREWQQLHAWTDLVEREAQLISVVADAGERGHRFDTSPTPLLAIYGHQKEGGDELLDRLRQSRDKARHAVLAFESESERRAKRDQPAARPKVEHPAVLSQAQAYGLFGAPYRQAIPPLGEAVRTAFRTNFPVDVISGSTVLVRVGERGWARELLERARKSLDALKRVDERRDELPAPAKPIENITTHLRAFRKAAADIEAFDQSAVDRFADVFKADAPLGRAVNELTALLTPARWKYEDVVPNVDVSGADQHVELYAGWTNVSAKFILNTAELNTLALAIFLLCARRIENPLRVLILDDPLQNMDELTVTTIARGVGRMLRLWKHLDGAGSPWRMFILLHGEDDMERIRREVSCAVHLLPWLSPRQRGANEPMVEPQVPLLGEMLQSLERVVTKPVS